MILSSVSLNRIDNIGFQRKSKKRSGISKKQRAIKKYNSLVLSNSGSDCFCKNNKNCAVCSQRQAELRQEMGLQILSVEEIDFMDNNPELATLIDFDYSAIVDELIQNKYTSNGIHEMQYVQNDSGDFTVLVSAVDGNWGLKNYMYSKGEFIDFMRTIKNIKLHLGIGNPSRINDSFDKLCQSLKKY